MNQHLATELDLFKLAIELLKIRGPFPGLDYEEFGDLTSLVISILRYKTMLGYCLDLPDDELSDDKNEIIVLAGTSFAQFASTMNGYDNQMFADLVSGPQDPFNYEENLDTFYTLCANFFDEPSKRRDYGKLMIEFPLEAVVLDTTRVLYSYTEMTKGNPS